MGRIAFVIIAGGEPPGVGAVAFVSFRIFNAVVVMYQGVVSVLIPIIRIGIAQVPGIQSQEGIMAEEQRSSVGRSQRQTDPIVGPVGPDTPVGSPSRIVHLLINGKGGRRRSEYIG